MSQISYDSFVNVKVFGAKGSLSVNDTPSIQAAIDYANANGKTELLFPSGTYTVTTLTDYENLIFVGDGTIVAETGTFPVTNLRNIARDVKGFRVVTQAAYDALPASKATDNTLYIIRG